MNTTLRFDPPPRFLMCPPRHFAVSYSINPWMDPDAWAAGAETLSLTAARQWQGLHHALQAQGAHVELVTPQEDLPDLVFTANAAVVLDGKALIARFRHPQRQAEEPVFTATFEALRARGLIADIAHFPEAICHEGAGDCLWDVHRRLFWMGAGFRSDLAAREVVAAHFGVPVVALSLADPAYYHLDTAFSPLPCGVVLYHPAAFTPDALDAIHARVAPEDRIALTEADATRFAANAVSFGRTILLSSCSEALRARLNERGYKVVKTPLFAFLRSGGSACCLTLRLDHRAAAAPGVVESQAVRC